MSKDLVLPGPQYAEVSFMSLFPNLPCLHSFALNRPSVVQPYRRLTLRVKVGEKILVRLKVHVVFCTLCTVPCVLRTLYCPVYWGRCTVPCVSRTPLFFRILWNLRKLDEVNADFRIGSCSLLLPRVTCVIRCLAIVYNITYMTSDCEEQACGTSAIPGLLQTAF